MTSPKNPAAEASPSAGGAAFPVVGIGASAGGLEAHLANAAIFVRDMEGHITYWNAGAEKLYGWSREEALGQISHVLLKTETSVPFDQILEELLRDGQWTGEFVHTRRDGGRINVLVFKSLDRDSEGNPAAILETLTDITERKRTETAMRRSEQRFRTAVGTVSSLIWTNNAAGEMEGEQPGWANFTGQEPEEYQGYGWAKAVHPDDAQPTIAAWDQAVAEKRVFVFEHRVRRADGEWRLCSIRAAPVLGEEGEIVEWVGVHTDITEQKRSEEIRRRSEERQRALITASSDVVYRMSADWSEMAPLDGHDLVASTAAPSRTWMDANIFPEDQPQIRAAIDEAIRTRSLFRMEHRVRRADGSEGWTVSRAVPLCDASGEIVEWFGTASDVTERHLAEAALRAGEERYRSIIDSSPDCIKVLDLEGHLLSLEAGLELLGIADATPLLGKSWIELWESTDDLAAAHAAVVSAAAGGEGKFVGFFRTLHGLDKWWDVAVTPVRDADGQPTRLLAVSRDVTESRAATEALRASEARKNAILQSALDAIITMDHEGRLVEFNPGAERIFGHAREAVLGLSLAEVIIPERMREMHIQGLKHYLSTGVGPVLNQQIELPALRADGTEFPAELAIVAIQGVEPPVFTAFLRDVTARKHAEEALRTEVTERKQAEAEVRLINSELEKRVAERVVELQEKAAELEMTSRYKSEFLANMSHELRTPLNSLLILSRALADNKTGNLSGQQMEWARTIEGSGTDLLKLIDEVLDLSRIEAGKAEIEVADVTLASVIDLNERAFRPVAEERKLSFTLTLDPGLSVSLCTDGHRLQQILKNLLANAFKFTSEGGVALFIAPAIHGWSTDHERLNRARRVIAFAVRDTGIGIPPDKQRIVFDAFRQAESGTARKYGGSGLGLAISRDLARLLGGTIRVESEPGVGSTFTLYLPDDSALQRTPDERALFAPGVAADQQASPPKHDASRDLLHGRKVLVVDDDARNIFALASLLENHEMDVLTATGGRAAIDIIKRTPDLGLVLMDIMMPEMDGYETIREIRQSPEFNSLPIIALTAKAMKGDREKCIEAGASDYISKPVNTDQLLSMISGWLLRHRVRID